MKKLTKFFMAALLAGMYSFGYAQTTYEWQKPPLSTEVEIGIITGTMNGGYRSYKKKDKSLDTDMEFHYTDKELYEYLLHIAKNKYGKTYPNISLRNFVSERTTEYKDPGNGWYFHMYEDHLSATVVVIDPKIIADDNLSKAIVKALQNIRDGSRLALDQIRTTNGDKEDFKDQVIEILLDEGYKVVAKEYLEKLYEEQQAQQSGIYNDRTTVQENNFSAVGYYINVKRTDSSIKVQIINVSTGEYEANTTVNLE